MPVDVPGRFLVRLLWGWQAWHPLTLECLVTFHALPLCSRLRRPAVTHRRAGEWGLRNACGRTTWLIGQTDSLEFSKWRLGRSPGIFQKPGRGSCRRPGAHAHPGVHTHLCLGYLPTCSLREQALCSTVPSNRCRSGDLCCPDTLDLGAS